jgi:hypothetical protein
MNGAFQLRRNRWLTVAWFASGATIAATMLVAWPFPVPLQIGLLFTAFAIFALLKVGYGKPIRPLAFLLGSVVPYVIVQFWLGSLGDDLGRPPEGLASGGVADSAAEEPRK